MNRKMEAKLCLAEKLKLMKATSVAGGKENAGAVLQTKSLYLVYSKEVKRFIPSLYRMLQGPL